MYSKESKSALKRDTCIPIFTETLFTKQNQPRCPSVDEWIERMENIYTIEYDSVTMNTLFGHVGSYQLLKQ
jgi:hypothetical protein